MLNINKEIVMVSVFNVPVIITGCEEARPIWGPLHACNTLSSAVILLRVQRARSVQLMEGYMNEGRQSGTFIRDVLSGCWVGQLPFRKFPLGQ